MSETIIKKIIKSLLRSIFYIHSRGIMHRDLKPENIVFSSNDMAYETKIIDFGLATLIKEPEFLYKRCGTPGFVAPEIIKLKNDQKYDEKCDIFSIGVIFYILLIGKLPFKSSNYKKVLRLNKDCNVDFDLNEFEDYSIEAVDLLKKMLAKDP